MAWTDKMVEDLCLMWKQGLTTGEIGKRLGVSKNSIVGKVHRLQLDARPSPIKKKNEAEDSPVAPTVSEEKTETVEVVAPVKPEKAAAPVKVSGKSNNAAVLSPNTANIKLTDLDNHTCRWPLGDPKDENFHFCGKKVRVGQTYCEEHSAIAYVKPNKK